MSEIDFDWSLGESGTTSTDQNDEGQGEAEAAQQDSGSRKRDSQGRFVSDGQADGVEGGSQGGDDSESQDHGLILGKFKSHEALEEAYKNLESEKGRAGNEVGELRKELQQLRESLQPEQSYAPVDDSTVSALDELALSNPQQAASWALQNQPILYDRVMEIWFANDPRTASRFETGLLMAQQQKTLMDQITPALQPLQAQTQEQQFARAWSNIGQKYSDLDTHAEAIMEAANVAPELATALQGGDVATKERMIENLLFLARGMKADTIAAAAVEASRATAQANEQDKLAASVATASSGQVRGEKSGIEEWKQKAFLDSTSTTISRTR